MKSSITSVVINKSSLTIELVPVKRRPTDDRSCEDLLDFDKVLQEVFHGGGILGLTKTALC